MSAEKKLRELIRAMTPGLLKSEGKVSRVALFSTAFDIARTDEYMASF